MKKGLEFDIIETEDALFAHIFNLTSENFAREFAAVPLHIKPLYKSYLNKLSPDFQQEVKTFLSDMNFMEKNNEKIEEIMKYNSSEKSYEENRIYLVFPKK